MNCKAKPDSGGSLSLWLDVHVDAIAPALLVLHRARDYRVEGEVAAHLHVAAGVHPGAHLADEDVAGNDGLAADNLDAPVLPRGVAPVARRTLTFFVRHGDRPRRVRRRCR